MASIPLVALAGRPVETPDVMGQYSRMVALKSMLQQQQYQQQMQPLQLQQQQLTVQQQQMQMDSEHAVMQAYADSGGDLTKAAQLAQQSGKALPKDIYGMQTMNLDLQQKFATLSKTQQEAAKDQIEQSGKDAGALLAMPAEQRAQYFAQTVAPRWGMNPQQLTPEAIQYWTDPTRLQFTAMRSDEGLKLIDEQRKTQQFSQEHGVIPEPQRQQINAQLANAWQSTHPNQPVPPENQIPQGATADQYNQLLKPMEFAVREGETHAQHEIANKLAQQRINIQVNPPGGGLNDAAMTQAAERYWQTGQLPPTARGTAGLVQNRAIMNKAAELHPEGSIAANTAEYKANAQSLGKLQTNYDNVQAFENTALRNIDLLDQTATQIPDLGSRFANIPVRAINASMIGTDKMAAFKTALATAQAEAAKVLNSASATGGVVSDSARHELQNVIDGNLPYSAMKASFQTLKQDMSNRSVSYQDQISDIKGRMGSAPSGGTTSQGQATHTYNPATGKIEAITKP